MLKIRRNGSRKGFTLAELLIVVAIIAVLVAIAVPLFVSSLSKAAKARDDANVRAVRGAAVAAILGLDSSNADDAANYNKLFKDGKLVENVFALAAVSATGKIESLEIKIDKALTEGLQDDGKYCASISSLDLETSFSLT